MINNFLHIGLFLCLVLNFLNAADCKDDKEYTIADFFAEDNNKFLFAQDVCCAVLSGLTVATVCVVGYLLNSGHEKDVWLYIRRRLLKLDDSFWALEVKYNNNSIWKKRHDLLEACVPLYTEHLREMKEQAFPLLLCMKRMKEQKKVTLPPAILKVILNFTYEHSDSDIFEAFKRFKVYESCTEKIESRIDGSIIKDTKEQFCNEKIVYNQQDIEQKLSPYPFFYAAEISEVVECGRKKMKEANDILSNRESKEKYSKLYGSQCDTVEAVTCLITLGAFVGLGYSVINAAINRVKCA